MLGEAQSRAILGSALRAARGEAQALLIASDLQLTRFANNAIHQNVAEANAALTVRCVLGRQVGSAVHMTPRRRHLHILTRQIRLRFLELANPAKSQRFRLHGQFRYALSSRIN